MNASGVAAAVLVAALLLAPAGAQESAGDEPRTLLELLERVREGARAEREQNERRESTFRAANEEQRGLLDDALAARALAESEVAGLEGVLEENDRILSELEETLRTRMGTLGELFGVVREVAGETLGDIESSLVSAQIPGREEPLRELAKSRELPALENLEQLWFVLQQEMTELGRVVRFTARVITPDGRNEERDVVRIGAFNAISAGRYLEYVPETGRLAELSRQPARHHLDTIRSFEETTEGVSGVSIDPSRGTVLSLLIQSPSLVERVREGGPVGYVILALGVSGLALAVYRLVVLGVVGGAMEAQAGKTEPDTGNPLGRVMAVYDRHRNLTVEALELKLEEAILRETRALERATTLVKVLSVMAPLLGLLGTVTGMIETFQAITLFGTGDPRLMAGGISQALVTTALGLVTALPLLLLHSLMSARSKTLVQVLEEESTGLVAAHAETVARHAGSR